MKTKHCCLLVIPMLLLAAIQVHAQGTAFTYQGLLRTNGVPASSIYDFRCRLFGSSNGAPVLTGYYTVTNVPVTSGLFAISPDFGAAQFNGQLLWMEIEVRSGIYPLPPNPPPPWEVQAPRVRLSPSPYAIFAANASNAVGVANNGVSTLSLQDGAVTVAKISASQVVKSLNGLRDYLNIVPGTNVSITISNGTNFVVSSTAPGAGSGSNPWLLAGNGGTDAGVNFLGTTDFEGLTLRVNNQIGLRLIPNGSTPQLIGGHASNLMTLSGIFGGTIGGGGDSLNPNRVSDDYSTIAGGQGNTAGNTNGTYADASHAFVGGGFNNASIGKYAAIAGGQNNIAAGLGASVGGGRNNAATNIYAAIGGGQSNSVFGSLSAVGGGLGNLAGSEAATIGGGRWNFISRSPDIPPVGCTISGGSSNQIFSGNAIDGLSSYSTISGGENNIVRGESDHGVVGGGGGNSIGSWSSYCAIGGGSLNNIAGQGSGNNFYDTIGGGHLNQISPSTPGGVMGATVSGGLENAASGYASTIPGGTFAKASTYGQMAYASGRFATNGDAQTSLYVCRGATTDGTLTELFLDGASQRIVVPVNSTWTFDAFVTARSSTGNSGGYQIRGTIKNNAGTTSIVGSPTFTLLGEDVAAWDAMVAADNANHALVVRVTGAAATSIRWVASLRTTEVIY